MHIDYQSELNEEQLKVVEHGDGPTLVLAGAGSGKTRTITYRVVWMLEHGVPADRILLVTFTNKAAKEMISRIEQLYGKYPEGLWAGTFHSIANKVLRENAHALGYTSGFSILDQDDSMALTKACVKESKVVTKGKRFPSPRVLQGLISYARNRHAPLADIIEERNASFMQYSEQISRIAEMYAQKKRESNSMDFDDLLCNLHTLLNDFPEIEDRLSEQFKYILVDEYQDTNTVQANIVARLGKVHRNVIVVGDDAQSIYSFRAADIRNILDFPNHFHGCQTYRLESNYRSTPEILELANSSIVQNKEQFKKDLNAMCEEGARPYLVHARSAAEEARYIVQQVKVALQRGVAPTEIAVLFRAAYQSRMLEFELMRNDLPYEYRGGMRFFSRAHIKDVLAFVRVIHNPRDTAAWLRLLGIQQGIGLVGAQKIIAQIHLQVSERLTKEAMAGVNVGKRSEMGWRTAFDTLAQAIDKPLLSEQIRAILQSSYVDYLEAEYPNASDRLEDLNQLEQFAIGYERDVDRFFEEVTLRDEFGKEIDEKTRFKDRIILSTIHQAKGLEWDTVCVMGLVDGQFPNRRSLSEPDQLEEERRLFYVAVTRAKSHLHLTYSTMGSSARAEIAVPSLFLEEVSDDLFEVVGGARLRSAYKTGTVFNDFADQTYTPPEPTITIDSDGERSPVSGRGFLKDI